MPNQDGTGPMGQGSRSGRERGKCNQMNNQQGNQQKNKAGAGRGDRRRNNSYGMNDPII